MLQLVRLQVKYGPIKNKITRLFISQVLSFLYGRQVFHLSHWKESPVCLTFLVSLEYCECKGLCALLQTRTRIKCTQVHAQVCVSTHVHTHTHTSIICIAHSSEVLSQVLNKMSSLAFLLISF